MNVFSSVNATTTTNTKESLGVKKTSPASSVASSSEREKNKSSEKENFSSELNKFQDKKPYSKRSETDHKPDHRKPIETKTSSYEMRSSDNDNTSSDYKTNSSEDYRVSSNYEKNNYESSQQTDKKYSYNPYSSHPDDQKFNDAENAQFFRSVRDVRGQQSLSDDLSALSKLSDKLDRLGRANEEVVDPLTRRTAIQSFMKKMKSEFDVEPKDLVVAFSQLETFELGLPPQQTLDKVVQNLDLLPQQKNEAKSYFRQMLQQTSSSSMADYLKGSGRQLSLEVMSQRDAQYKMAQKSLDNMNQKFFMSSAGQLSTTEPLSSQVVHSQNLNSLNTKAQEGFYNGSSYGKNSSQNSQEGMSLAGLGMKSVSPQQSGMTLASVPGSFSSPLEMASVQTPTNLLSAMNLENQGGFSPDMNFSEMNYGMSTEPTEQALQSMSFTSEPLMGSQVSSKMTTKANHMPTTTEGLADALSGLNLADSFNTSSEGSGAGEGGEESMDPFFTANPNLQNTTKTTDTEFKTQMMSETSMTDPDMEADNVNELISKAKVLAEKGGGEVKVILKPEGMGEVNVKVALEEGKLNVEMLTESQNAKRIIEKGLADLKMTLNTHNLDVDSIKVDLSNDMTENFKEQQRDAERQFAQQFLQDFRNGNRSFRGGVEFPGDKYFKSQTEDAADNSHLRPEQKRKSNRKLDLVA